MTQLLVERFRVIDVDAHVVEPPDLWTSRMSLSRWGDRVPSVRVDPVMHDEAWFIGDRRIASVGNSACAGWREFPPNRPPLWTDTPLAGWDARERLKKMDEYGIQSQVLYPNIMLFHNAATLTEADELELSLEYVRAYNDYQTQWCSEAPERLIPVASIPFWDRDATLQEMARCAELGHRGIVMSQEPSFFGLPHLTDPHWDQVWAAAQEMQLSVNFHVGSGDKSAGRDAGHPSIGEHAIFATYPVSFFMSNARTIANLVFGGICHRFPDLKFVSVESGVGWVPFALDTMDWQWKNAGVHIEHPDYELLPSEYFKRQMYASFWFEEAGAMYAIERLGPDRFLYETDFPHPTSMSPGPASYAEAPKDFIERTLVGLPDDVLAKVLHDNAAQLYKLS